MSVSHRSRLETTLSGQKPDRPPVALWRHFPIDDQYPEELAASIVRFQEKFEFDFVKITPASSFCLQDYGLRDEWQGNPEGSKQVKIHPVVNEGDWLKIKPLDPRKGSLGSQLKCIRLIRESLPDSTPIIQTIFSPLSQAKNLVGKENLLSHLRMYPEQVKSALHAISQTTQNFINECITLKVDGIFYAVQHAQYSLMNLDEFREFGTFFDKQILESTKPLWLNIGHLHGSNVMYDELCSYPIHVLNWHDRETSPNLKEGKFKFAGTVCGGLRQWETLAFGSPDQVIKESLEAIHQTNGTQFILGTGCVTPVIAPDVNIFAARKAVEK
jgi:uroporphyrinogen decarboxylase